MPVEIIDLLLVRLPRPDAAKAKVNTTAAPQKKASHMSHPNVPMTTGSTSRPMDQFAITEGARRKPVNFHVEEHFEAYPIDEPS